MLFVAALGVGGLPACGASELTEARGQGEAQGEGGQALVGGFETWEKPEVGQLCLSGMTCCTATLVAPKVVLTAAHCLNYGARGRGDHGTFEIKWKGPFGMLFRSGYRVSEYKSLRGHPTAASPLSLRDDIGLVRLAEDVPVGVARPAPMTPDYPPVGSWVLELGYGCTDRFDVFAGLNTKRALMGTVGPFGAVMKALCPGDSGGPLFDGAGRVVGVASYYAEGGIDVHALLQRKWDDIRFVTYLYQASP